MAKAMKHFRTGAELGNADAQWMLGNCYQKGIGVEKDNIEAYALISAAVDGVDDPAQKQGMTEKRDKLCKELSANQLKEAERLAEE
jgi:TPR repeat protein